MVNLLLLDCYLDSPENKIETYVSFIHSVGLQNLNIVVLNENGLPPSFKQFDGVVISGAKRMISDRQYSPLLLDLIVENRKPLMGICYGHQLLGTAFGGEVVKDKQFHKGKEIMIKVKDDRILAGFPENFKMEESHLEFVVWDQKLEKWFLVLAHNQKNQVEIIKHRMLPIYGVQFHPERSGKFGRLILKNFFNLTFGNRKGDLDFLFHD